MSTKLMLRYHIHPIPLFNLSHYLLFIAAFSFFVEVSWHSSQISTSSWLGVNSGVLLEKRNAARCQHHKKKTINAFQQIPFFSAQKRDTFAQVADVKLSRISAGVKAILLVIAAEVAITVEWHEKHHRANHGLRTRRFFKTPGLYCQKIVFFGE